MRTSFRPILFAAILFAALFVLPSNIKAQPPQEVMNAAETKLALKKLNILGSALYVAAHPDDENTSLLAYLSGERKVCAAYLSVTRGDGGQNLIGTEQGALLGLVRTQELLAARRIDGAQQFFTRAIDFGYSKSPEETFAVWGREAVLSDVVWVIRRFRPDVIITRFPTTGEGGHGQHTASAILAVEAFEAAGDPARFPEQLKYVETWKPKRLMWNGFSRGGGGAQANRSGLISVDVGAYNSLLGKSYTEIAANSRSMHKSQGFGSAERRGSALNTLQTIAGDAPGADLFDGVDLSWRRVPGGEAVGKILEEAERTYEPENPQASLPLLIRAHREMSKLPADNSWVEVKRRELLDVIRACSGLWIEAIAAEATTTPGGEVRVTATLVNRSNYPFRLESVGLPFNAGAHLVNAELKNNQPLSTPLAVRVPPITDFTQPYWLRDTPGKGTYSVNEQKLAGLPEGDPAMTLTITLSTPDGDKLSFETPALYRWTDRVRGELYRPFVVVPAVTLNMEEKVYVFPDGRAKRVGVVLRGNSAGVAGALRLKVPAGWRVEPESLPMKLSGKNEEMPATFTVTPSSGPSTGTIAAEFADGAASPLSRGVVSINHEHIPPQIIFPPAEAKLVRLDLQRRGERIGYIMGSGDEIPDALRQIGYSVVLLSDGDLDNANLTNFDAIITGVRAYNTRPRLRQAQKRLLDYVEAGGTLIVQYNTSGDIVTDSLGPYPLTLSRDRVTVEEAPVTFVMPNHPLLNTPNKITPADFDGWMQERGLYFPGDWDARYETPLATRDPGESDKRGGLLVARHGKGTYIYTGYAWFRQLPAGVPGAYRLFVNMISAGK